MKVELSLLPTGKVALRTARISHAALRILQENWTKQEKHWNGEQWELDLIHLDKLRKLFDPMGELSFDEGILREISKADKRQPATFEPTDYKFKVEPFHHQRRAFHLGRKAKFFALLMEQGTGKTKAAIDIDSHLIQKGELDCVLIVTIKSTLFNWAREIKMNSPLENPRVLVLEGKGTEKLEALETGIQTCQFIITNYDFMARTKWQLLAPMIRAKRVGLILDESTRMKNPASTTAKTLHRIGPHAAHRMILTGTPVTNSPLDCFSQFFFLHPDILGHHNFTSFKAEYAIMVPFNPSNKFMKMPASYKNLDRLQAQLRQHSFRVLKKDCLDLPEKIYRVLEIPMGEQQGQLYKEMAEDSVVQWKGETISSPIVLTRMMRLQQITGGFLPKIDEHTGHPSSYLIIEDAPKAQAVKDLIEVSLDAGKKVIVWFRFKHEISNLIKITKEWNEQTVLITGDTSAEERELRIRVFNQDNKKAVLFFGQIKAGGIGTNLQAASHVIYYSSTFSLEDRLQSEDRAHRIGQRNDVLYDDVVMKGTIDKTILAAHRNKKNLADLVTGDNMRAAFNGELDV